MGGADPPRRGGGHGQHCPHAAVLRLRPPRQPPQLRQGGRHREQQHAQNTEKLLLLAKPGAGGAG